MPTIHTTDLKPGHWVPVPQYGANGERTAATVPGQVITVTDFDDGIRPGVQAQVSVDGQISFVAWHHGDITIHAACDSIPAS